MAPHAGRGPRRAPKSTNGLLGCSRYSLLCVRPTLVPIEMSRRWVISLIYGIKKSDLYSSLWASCDELRGGMDRCRAARTVTFPDECWGRESPMYPA